MNIDIVLPYYNGSKYIKEQLDSIRLCLIPEGYSLRVILINDCSSSEHATYLKSILDNYSFIEFHENVKNLGVVKTVEKGLKLSTAHYVLLADQDDYWLPEKIIISMRKLFSMGDAIPNLVFTDLHIVDKKLKHLHPSMFKLFNFRPEKIRNGILIKNIVTGCTVAFNRKLIEVALPFPDDILIHDHWLAICATYSGEIEAIHTPTVLYRQHGGNLIGAQHAGYWSKMIKIRSVVKSKHHSHLSKSNQTLELVERLKERGIPHADHNLELIAGAMQANNLHDVLILLREKVFNIRLSRKIGIIGFFLVMSTINKFRRDTREEGFTLLISKLVTSGIGTVLSSIFGIGLIKMISIKSGPENLGYFGVFRQFFQLMTVMFTLGNGYAVIEGSSKSQDLNSFTKNVSSYTFIVCIVLSLFVLLLSYPITEGLFGDLQQINLIRLMPIMIFSVAYTLLMKSLYNGMGRLIHAGFFLSFSYMFMFLVSIFSTELLNIYLYGSILSGIMALTIFKERSLLIPSLNFKRMPSFERTAISTAITGVTGFLSFLIVRAICLNELGPDEGGYLESSWSLVNYTVLIFLTSLSAYYLPQVAARPEDGNFRIKFFYVINFCSLLSLLSLCFGKSIIIPLLFSKKFLPTSDLLVIMSVGEYFKCLNYFFSFSLIGMAKKRPYLILDTIANLTFVILAFLIPTHHIKDFGFIYIAYQTLYLLGSFYLNVRYKIIPKRYVFFNFTVGLSIWASYLFFNYG